MGNRNQKKLKNQNFIDTIGKTRQIDFMKKKWTATGYCGFRLDNKFHGEGFLLASCGEYPEHRRVYLLGDCKEHKAGTEILIGNEEITEKVIFGHNHHFEA